MIFLKSTSTIEFEELHVAYLSSLPELENIEEENKLLESEEKYYNEVCSVAQNMIESLCLYESSFKDFDDLKSDSAQNKNETEPKAVATKLVQDNVVVAERTFKRSLLAYVTNKEDAQGLVNKIGDLNYSGMVELEEIRGLLIHEVWEAIIKSFDIVTKAADEFLTALEAQYGVGCSDEILTSKFNQGNKYSEV